MNNDCADNLLRHFNGEEDTFLITIRCDLLWNHDFFIDMVSNMIDYCHISREEESLSREFAHGFWYASWFVKDWSGHENFRSKNSFTESYYERCYQLLSDLSYQFFVGESLYEEELSISAIEEELLKLK